MHHSEVKIGWPGCCRHPCRETEQVEADFPTKKSNVSIATVQCVQCHPSESNKVIRLEWVFALQGRSSEVSKGVKRSLQAWEGAK